MSLQPALEKVLLPVLGDVTVENLQPLTGGASRTTWAFDAVGDRRRALILRTGAPDDIHASMELEARVQQRAAAAGAPVPHILTADNSAAALGSPYLICAAIPGETIVRRIFRSLDEDRRSRLLTQCAEALAAIHRADPDGIGLTTVDELAGWRTRLDEIGDTTATFEWTFRRLAEDRPDPSPMGLVHGDFRMGNLIVDDSGLAAVLDWELTHIGESYEDLAWFCIRAWRFGAPENAGRGRPGRRRVLPARLRAGRRCGGRPRGLPVVAHGGYPALGGDLPAPGRAAPVRGDAVGRTRRDRAAGQRNGVGSAGTAGGKGRTAMTTVSTRPTAAELVGAVADFLDNDVRAACAGQVGFHVRVAANVLRIVERELQDASGARSWARSPAWVSPTRPGSRRRSATAGSTTVPTR